jgi:hypothetical protein
LPQREQRKLPAGTERAGTDALALSALALSALALSALPKLPGRISPAGRGGA